MKLACQHHHRLDLRHAYGARFVLPWAAWFAATAILVSVGGCSLVPEGRTREVLHNPFPQLKRVAVLPFFNQSHQPHVDGDAVARAYYAALQSVPGFEVLPVGVTDIQLQQYIVQYGPPQGGQDFQRLAQWMGVEAVVVGSVTDFEEYYPPRMALTVRWYAANEGFHPIPPGYGLPWGTDEEETIPRRVVREAEFELARSQLQTQTPVALAPGTASRPGTASPPGAGSPPGMQTPAPSGPAGASPHRDDPFAEESDNPLRNGPGNASSPATAIAQVSHSAEEDLAALQIAVPLATPLLRHEVPSATNEVGEWIVSHDSVVWPEGSEPSMMAGDPLPADWPDPTDLIPDGPAMSPPAMLPSHEPVLTHTRLYRGDDPYFTQRLADYVETGDDARGASWQGYVKRSDDFIRFCCHLHLSEMLEARGGRDASDLILRWPVSRY